MDNFENNKCEIIKFSPPKDVIEDADLISLFMGIVKIVKNNVKEEYLTDIDKINLEKIRFLEKKVEVYKAQNQVLKKQNENLKVQNERLKLKLVFKN